MLGKVVAILWQLPEALGNRASGREAAGPLQSVGHRPGKLFRGHRDFEKFQGRTAAEFLAWLRKILVNNIAREVEKHILSAKRDVSPRVRLDGMQTALERSAARLESVFVDQASSPSSRVRLEGVEDVAGRDPQRHTLRAVDFQVQPGSVGVQAVEYALQARRGIGLVNDLVTDAWKSPSPKLPRSSIMIFNPPVVPGPLARWPAGRA